MTLHQGRGFTRDISPKGLFVYSNSLPRQKPIFKSRFFLLLSPGQTQISSLGLTRWYSAWSRLRGEGNLTDLRFSYWSCKVHDGVTPIED